MDTAVIIFLFLFAVLINICCAFHVYNWDKKQYLQNAHRKMIEHKLFKYLLKYDRKTPQIYLKTLICNLLLGLGLVLEIIFFVFSLNYLGNIRYILSFCMITLSLLTGCIITITCKGLK